MMRRLALTGVLTVLSVMALAPKAQAQLATDQPVTFEGTVGSVCTFDMTEGGILAEDENGDLSTFADGGESGTTTVNCTAGGDITVAPPQPMEVPNGFTGEATAIVFDPENLENSVDSDGDGTLQVSAGDFDLDVDMAVVPDEELLPGTYEYEVVVTATATE